MESRKTVSYWEYLEMFRFTPEGYLRFDVLLEEFLRLSPPSEENKEEKRIFQENLEKLLNMADPKDFGIIRNSETWKNIEESLD